MPTFQYEAVNASGKSTKGTIEASSREDAQGQLKGQGMFPTSVEEFKLKGRAAKQAKAQKDGKAPKAAKKKGRGISLSIGRVNTKKMTTFTRQLSTTCFMPGMVTLVSAMCVANTT